MVDIFEIFENEIGKKKVLVQWCHEKESDYSQIWYKKRKLLQKKLKNTLIRSLEDPLDRFIALTKPKFIHYHDIETILGSTCDMLIIQDFDRLTPNILAQSIETVAGGGIIVFITKLTLDDIKNLKMFVHARYTTESFPDVINGLFNNRLISSLSSCRQCLIIDDEFNLTHDSLQKKRFDNSDIEEELPQKSLADIKLKAKSENAHNLITLCKTYDQGKTLNRLMKAISKNYENTIALTSGRGRGKSATLGLAAAFAISSNHSRIIVTAPSASNLKTFFSFVCKGLDQLGYNSCYRTFEASSKEVTKIIVTKDYTQTIQYIQPRNFKDVQANLLIIDEAAAIPLSILKPLIGKTLTFMASTVCGYEGTGRSLSLKLIEELREQTKSSSREQKFQEVTMNECIRYGAGDAVEQWLYDLLCLETNIDTIDVSNIQAKDCNLYFIDKKLLFNFEPASESFLQKMMGLYAAAHYRNSPNDLQMLMDAPMHQLFCLLPPYDPNSGNPPEPLCVVHLSFEGKLSQKKVKSHLESRQRAFGDLIPWSLSQQYQHDCRQFFAFAGGRIVRIATHQSCQKMGFGKQALHLLSRYFSGTIGQEESAIPSDYPFLVPLHRRVPEELEYLGVSFGLTNALVRFWKKAKYTPVYLRQIPNELTGEHSLIMLKCLNKKSDWLPCFYRQFERKFLSLMGMPCFRRLEIKICQELIKGFSAVPNATNTGAISALFDPSDIARLKHYLAQKLDFEYILDLVPSMAQLYFAHHLDVHLNVIQSAVLLAVGLHREKVDRITQQLTLDTSQFNALFKQTLGKLAPAIISAADLSADVSCQPQPKKQKVH